MKNFTKQDKLDLIKAIRDNQIDPAEINEDSLFCTDDGWFYDTMILLDEAERTGNPPKELFFLGDGAKSFQSIKNKLQENEK